MSLFDRIVNPDLLVRRMTITSNRIVSEDSIVKKDCPIQLDLFTDYDEQQRIAQKEAEDRAKERRMQEALLSIKKRYGKNSVLKGINFAEGATAIERNQQIGGHKA
jgi:DNA polymerase V